MLETLIVLAFLAALGLGAANGILSRKRGRAIPLLGHAHGAVALSAMGLLFYRILIGPENLWFNTALFLFLLALIGGGFAWLVRERGETPILPLVMLHASMALVAFFVLLGGL
ncbi:MAG: hypothetical protein JJU06_20700 [Ectothiorhodospiraceae bacterium]|nr:hypothetical protein [Ectothiorhodospiraceae bacterium]